MDDLEFNFISSKKDNDLFYEIFYRIFSKVISYKIDFIDFKEKKVITKFEVNNFNKDFFSIYLKKIQNC